MWTISEVKSRGKGAFLANYFKSVIAAFVLSLLTAGTAASTSSQADKDNLENFFQTADPTLIYVFFGTIMTISFISLILKIFLFNPLQVGGYRFFKRNVEEGNVGLNVLTEGFGTYAHSFITLFLRDLFLCLWSCLFLIPGIIKAYSYRMVPYIIKDNPELSATQVITRSREMMNGHKWNAFVYDLSFIGWYILGIIPFAGQILTIFWTAPYKQNSDAALYLEISGHSLHS